MTALASLLLGASLAFVADAQIHGEVVRLGDLADVSVLPAQLRGKAAELPLARVASDTLTASVPGAFLASQVRARMPVLAPWLAQDQPVTVQLHRREPALMPVVRSAMPAGVAKGERVSLSVAAGPFLIEREGVALGAARLGEHLFVRTAGNQVIVALCAGAGR